MDSFTITDAASTMARWPFKFLLFFIFKNVFIQFSHEFQHINIYHNLYNAAYNPVFDYKISALNVSV